MTTSLDLAISQPLHDGLLVARRGGYRMLVMNGSARFMWERLASGVPIADIPVLVAEQYQIELARAQQDFDALLREWMAEGLVRSAFSRRHYSLAGIGFTVDCADAAQDDALAQVIGHLGVARPPGDADAPQRGFSLVRDGAETVLFVDGTEACRAATLDKTIERLLADALLHVYDNTDWVASVHAAALGDERGCLLLPGVSGTGKTTLTAALLAGTGLRYLTDDIALLRSKDLCVEPVPGPLVLKRGSWPLLEAALPELAAKPNWRRFDDDVRYWSPPVERIATTSLPVTAVALPRRRAGVAARLVPISPLEGLNGIIAAPATIQPPITAATLERLAGWAKGIAFHRLEYARVEEAVPLLESLLGA